jgi:hypothetical protein
MLPCKTHAKQLQAEHDGKAEAQDRTPIGFHDAYIAATSQKEALKARGTVADLFARGIADARNR